MINRTSRTPSGGRTRRAPPARPRGAVAEECREALSTMRSALIEALGQAGVDSAHPREAARRLGVDKNLMWRVSKIVSQPELLDAVASVPRRNGFARLCEALARSGVDEQQLARVSHSLEAFDQLVAHHAGDRDTFEMVVGGMGSRRHAGAALEQARKLAFRGNSGVWGVQARNQVFTTLLAPHAGDAGAGLVDAIQIFGLTDLRRLRPDMRWTLALRRVGDDAGCKARAGGGEPLDPDAPADGSGLIRAFSSDPFPELVVEETGGEARYVLQDGEVGRTGELTALFAMRKRALGSQTAGPHDRFAQFIVHLNTPVEHLHVDLLVHADLAWALDPQVALFGRLEGRGYHFGCGREGLALPCIEDVRDLGAGLTGAATPRLPQYPQLLSWAFERSGWDPSRFHMFRFELAYPPMPAQAILFSELLPASGAEKGAR